MVTLFAAVSAVVGLLFGAAAVWLLCRRERQTLHSLLDAGEERADILAAKLFRSEKNLRECKEALAAAQERLEAQRSPERGETDCSLT